MILRRIATAFRKQDWFTVAIETLIVIFGVFIGLQVNNWNEGRADLEWANRNVTQMAEDIRSDIRDIENGINTSQWRSSQRLVSHYSV
jgi:hypothetical protein